MTKIKAYVFDVYGTLFDVHSVSRACDELFPNQGIAISQTWRQKQIEYSFLRQLTGNYKDFFAVTKDSLRYAIQLHCGDYNDSQLKKLLEKYLTLNTFPEVIEVLDQLRESKLAVFSNGSHQMLDPLLKQAAIYNKFNHIISVDEIKQYKPTSESYQYCLNTLKVNKEEVLFMSSNGWDITGAKSFGFQTAWINRNKLPVEQLQLEPDAICNDLRGIID
ncbi:haloacid dehalogenase type II [Aquibacillus salsiterrae]|uniref:Haloacid dehalogenase type II n=1 Tax=Aquibacillus salsiterrae TaxID=2950439 RepID=A0A9X4AEV2_9BACI|nr:haloacid dehalogenase type II [Aquibacillus salsiterrae]MDC3417337.1 haloacid dehalogenase type II [Aquibacillus salsiterrae]